MECFECGTPYNEGDNCPRLLINCGHSLCQRCLIEYLGDGPVQCPECRTINKSASLSEFPKNLALIQMKPAPLGDRKPNRYSLEPASEQTKDPTNLCQKHKKKVEAFCENDRNLLCITCILEEGYKNQDICSIQDAALKERNLIQKAFELSQIIEGKLNDLGKDLTGAQQMLTETAEKGRMEITQFFNEIRKVIAERETVLKQKLSEELRKQEHSFRKKEDNLDKHVKSVLSFYEEYHKSLSEKDIPLLRSSHKRIEIIKKATADLDRLNFTNPFGELNKESELNVLWRMIGSLKSSKDVSHPPPSGYGHVGRGLRTANAQPNALKNKGTKDYLNKPSGSGLRQSTNVKKEAVPSHIVPSGQSSSFGIADKSGSKNAGHGGPKETRQRDEGNIENRRSIFWKSLTKTGYRVSEKRAPSPVRTSVAKNKYPQSYYAMRNSQKEKEALRERANPDQINEHLERSHENKNSKSTVVSTPKHTEPEESNSEESAEIISAAYESRSSQDYQGRQVNNSQHRQHWATDTGNFDKGIEEEIDRKQRIPVFDLSNDDPARVHDKVMNLLNGDKRGLLSQDLNINVSTDLLQHVNMTDMSLRRDMRLLSPDMANSTLCDVTDLSQKLDFSVLCQHSTSCLYVMGGYIEDSQHFIEKYDTQKGKWEIAGTFVNNRTKFSCMALPESGIILIMGGKQDGHRTAKCEQYSIVDQVVKPTDISLTSPKSGFGSFIIKDEIFICGGNDGHSILKTFESYNLKTKKWTTLTPLQYKRDELAVTIGLDQKIYAIGGFGGPNNECLNQVERYNPQEGCWEIIAPLNTPRRALSAVTLPDGIYAIGGFDGESYLSTVEKYEEATNEWIFVASMNYPRCTLSAVVSSDFRNIFVLGGFDNGPLKSVERYSVIDNTWEIMPPLHFKRFMHAAVMVSRMQGNRWKGDNE